MADRYLRLYLQFGACVLLVALPCAALPYAWMDAIHRMLGLGTLPNEPMVLYLARSASLLYAAIGCLYLFMARELPRYRDLLRFLAWLEVGLGLMLLPIDLWTGMPWFWTACEATFIVGWALGLLALLRLQDQPAPTEEPAVRD